MNIHDSGLESKDGGIEQTGSVYGCRGVSSKTVELPKVSLAIGV